MRLMPLVALLNEEFLRRIDRVLKLLFGFRLCDFWGDRPGARNKRLAVVND